MKERNEIDIRYLVLERNNRARHSVFNLWTDPEPVTMVTSCLLTLLTGVHSVDYREQAMFYEYCFIYLFIYLNLSVYDTTKSSPNSDIISKISVWTRPGFGSGIHALVWYQWDISNPWLNSALVPVTLSRVWECNLSPTWEWRTPPLTTLVVNTTSAHTYLLLKTSNLLEFTHPAFKEQH